MQRSEVLREVSFISRLLQSEFVYGTEGLEANVDNTLASLKRDGVVIDEDGWIGLAPSERARGRENFGKHSVFRLSSYGFFE